jgi:hypothetical protein
VVVLSRTNSYHIRVRRLMSLLCLVLLTLGRVVAHVPPVSSALPESKVENRVLAYLLSLMVNDSALELSRPEIERMFPEVLTEPWTPFTHLTTLTRVKAESDHAADATVNATFSRMIDYDIPVDLFGYHPVHLHSSEQLNLVERTTYLPTGERVHVLELVSGWVEIDFDGWLDFLAGRLLDDASVTHVAATEHEGAWVGLLIGESPQGRLITWVFDFTRTRIKLRPPEHFAELGERIARSGSR